MWTRGVAPSLAATIALIGAIVVSAQTPGSLPIEPVKESGNSITGAFEGWYPNPDGTSTLLVGYFNRNSKQVIDIPVGPNNRIEPGGPDQGQPTHFLPRRQWGVFTIKVPKDFGKNRLTWTLVANGQTTTVPMHLDPLWIVEPFKDAALGNTPPTLRFDKDGKPFVGPPVGIASSMTATVGKPLTLSVWVTDDGVRAPEARRREGPPATVSWSLFRGPISATGSGQTASVSAASVSFDKAAPPVDAEGGNATTNATFSAPGEYILRVQSNDATGDGGGGFQCCWTNAHVRVVVQ